MPFPESTCYSKQIPSHFVWKCPFLFPTSLISMNVCSDRSPARTLSSNTLLFLPGSFHLRSHPRSLFSAHTHISILSNLVTSRWFLLSALTVLASPTWQELGRSLFLIHQWLDIKLRRRIYIRVCCSTVLSLSPSHTYCTHSFTVCVCSPGMNSDVYRVIYGQFSYINGYIDIYRHFPYCEYRIIKSC